MLRLVANNCERIDQGSLPRNPAPLARLTRFLSTSRIHYEAVLKGALHPVYNSACNLTQIKVLLSPEQARQFLIERRTNPLGEAYQIMLADRDPKTIYAQELKLLPKIVERFAGRLPALPPVEEFIYSAFSPPPQLAVSFFFDPQGGLKYMNCDFAGRIYLETMHIRNREYSVLRQDKDGIFFSFRHATNGSLSYGLVFKDPLVERLINISVSDYEGEKPRVSLNFTPLDPEAERDDSNRWIRREITYLSREELLDLRLPILQVHGREGTTPIDVLPQAIERMFLREGSPYRAVKPLGQPAADKQEIEQYLEAYYQGDLLVLFWAKKMMLQIEALVN